MYGRYGSDRLSVFVSYVSLIFFVLAFIKPLRLCIIPAVLLTGWSVFRLLSRNIYRRRKELDAYLRIKSAVTGEFRLIRDRWRDRKTHKYYRCPGCRAIIRIRKPPRGHKIGLTCPRCGKKFDRRG